jgi:hypothetical protein
MKSLRTARGLPRPRDLVPLIVVDEAALGEKPLEGRTKLTKLVFLAQREVKDAVLELIAPDEPFRFIPYNYGPFSSELLTELEDMARKDLIEIERRPLDSRGRAVEFLYRPTARGREIVQSAEPVQAARIVRNLVANYATFSRNRLVHYIHERYPDAVPGSVPSSL